MLRISFIVALLFYPLLLLADGVGIRNVDNGVEMRNEHVAILLSKNAELISFKDLYTNKEISTGKKEKIAFAKTTSGAVTEATRLSLVGDILYLALGNFKIELQIHAFDDYFTVEVQNKSLPGVESLTFWDLTLNGPSLDKSIIGFSGIAMTLQTNPVFFPVEDNSKVTGICTSQTGFLGAKLAIIACPKSAFWENVKRVYWSLPTNSVPVVFSSGGPFAYDNEANQSDCVILSGAEVNSENVPKWIDFYTKLGVRQIEFYLGSYTFTQGQFSFPTFGNASSFNKQITEPLSKAGIISLLHTYSFYISYSSEEILRNPKWQKQLEFRGVFPLSRTITADERNIKVSGSISGIKNPGYSYSVYTPYFLVDNEIIRYSIGKDGFVNCLRGQCGTTASSHSKGAKARVIGGYYNYMAPQIGSELYYEIARRTAKTYNEGGFRGFYFDALDGLVRHLEYAGLKDYLWYYGAAFLNEVLKYCEKEPLVLECSQLYPTIWSARGRGECWDTPRRGYKNFIDDHISRNQFFMRRHYVGSLGWYDFYPEQSDQPGGYSTKYMFSDDIDYLGVKSIVYNQTMVHDGLVKNDVESNDALKRNLGIYSSYNTLRQAGYFSDRIKNAIKDGPYEYKLFKKDGRWGFRETLYCHEKIRDIKNDLIIGKNPFKLQKPFIRLENLYSSDCSSMINLLEFNDGDVMTKQNLVSAFSVPMNISNYLGVQVSVKGNGRDSKDALCIRLRSLELTGYADYIVRLNYDGWRDVIIPSLDNAEFSDLKFPEMEDDYYRMHRNEVDFSQVNSISVFKSVGCGDVQLKRINAVPLVENPITNPKISIGNTSVTFEDTLGSGEYLEYHAGEKYAVVYDRNGASRRISVKRKGLLLVPRGSFSAKVSAESELDNAPTEVVLTLGLHGKFIHN